ncbi:MotA/TolQ/ExbB proton channel family protein [Lacihabitans sp. CCS-44]|uniref:MotA/TolQ/ExbB proton channel family protein n=1 Tax=Lacihabitans sp. CCS-44 TaxID=2487331 RepID=UPI0020CF8A3C|nr:MotA/TolQ/ExbB proton channel family protein [Lacihabitans sp. CCS-44]MCP9754826.1 MotA/TolQ/ExbB proton channel family protein [Lacihabitans sp. CCS-44]
MEKKTKAPAAKPAKKSSGINPIVVIPLLMVIAFAIYYVILGSPANFEDAEKHNPKNALGIIYSGGIIVPFLITFMLTVLVFSIERFITLGKAAGSGDLDAFVKKVRTLLDQNNIADAMKECEKQKGTVGNVTKTALEKYAQLQTDSGLNKEQKLAALQKEIEEATSLELPMLEKNLTILSTLASVSTLVALLGTVIGMIKSFFALGSGGGSPDAAALAKGIAEALINTGLGIGTSAIAIMVYNYFTSSIDTLTYKIDEIGMSLQQNFSSHN